MTELREHDTAPPSDTETQEKPVREQLKKATIQSSRPANGDGTPGPTPDQAVGQDDVNMQSPDQRGRLQRKRSHEEVDDDTAEAVAPGITRQHTRKRSRDSAADEAELTNGQRKISGEGVGEEREGQPPNVNGSEKLPENTRPATPDLSADKRGQTTIDSVSSPKTKRSRLHSGPTIEDSITLTGTEAPTSTKQPEQAVSNAGESERTAAHEDPKEKDPSAAAAAGGLAGSKSPQTSATAFASSGFSALSGSKDSGFGAIGKSSGGFGAGGGFATGSKSPTYGKEEKKPAVSASTGFGGTLGQTSAFSETTPSVFGSANKTGFAKLGTGIGTFGTGTGFGGLGKAGSGGLTSFASVKPSSTFGGSKATSAFGAPADDDDEGGDDDEGDEATSGMKSPLATEEDKQDERFYEQEVETGEEDEITEYSCKAKLFVFTPRQDGKKEWVERGLGILKLNSKKLSDATVKPQARILMRAHGSHRVVLNTPITKEIKFGNADGSAPTNGCMLFMGTVLDSGEEKAGLELMQLKMKAHYALDVHDKITELQKDM